MIALIILRSVELLHFAEENDRALAAYEFEIAPIGVAFHD